MQRPEQRGQPGPPARATALDGAGRDAQELGSLPHRAPLHVDEQHTLLDVASDQGHPLRRQFDELLEEWAAELQTSPAVMARADEVKRQLFDHPTSRRLSASLWEEVKRILDSLDETTKPIVEDGVVKTILGD